MKALLRRHESLRTNFAVADQGWLQVVVDPAAVELPWQVEDLASAADLDERVRRGGGAAVRRRAMASRSARLVMRVGPHDHVLVMTMHHIAVDGWSVRRLLVELIELYSAGVEGRAPGSPSCRCSTWTSPCGEQQFERSRSSREALSYWTDRLSGTLPVLDLPADRGRSAVQRYSSGTVRTDLGPELFAAVRAAAAAAGVTPFVFLLASYVATLARWSGQDDVVVGTAAANRARPEVDDVVGMFVNTLALRCAVSMSPHRSQCCSTRSKRRCWGRSPISRCRSTGSWKRSTRSAT